MQRLKVSERADSQAPSRVWQNPIVNPVQFPGSVPGLETPAVKVVNSRSRLDTRVPGALGQTHVQETFGAAQAGFDLSCGIPAT